MKAKFKDGLIFKRWMLGQKYIQIIKEIAKNRNMDLSVERYDSREEAQVAVDPFTTYSFFFNGEFITNEIFSDKKFIKFMDENEKDRA